MKIARALRNRDEEGMTARFSSLPPLGTMRRLPSRRRRISEIDRDESAEWWTPQVFHQRSDSRGLVIGNRELEIGD